MNYLDAERRRYWNQYHWPITYGLWLMAYGLWQKYFYKLKRDTLKYIPAFAVLLLSGGALTPTETNKFPIFLLETDQYHISFMAIGIAL